MWGDVDVVGHGISISRAASLVTGELEIGVLVEGKSVLIHSWHSPDYDSEQLSVICIRWMITYNVDDHKGASWRGV